MRFKMPSLSDLGLENSTSKFYYCFKSTSYIFANFLYIDIPYYFLSLENIIFVS